MSKTKRYLILFFAVFIFFAPLVAMAQSNLDYKIMESIPGIISAGEIPDFNQYVGAIYKFGIMTVGIAALLMLSIGAYMYLTSAGNNAAMSSAKEVITDALIGLVLALFSWLLLSLINPDLSGPTGLTSNGGLTPVTPTVEQPAPRGSVATVGRLYRRLDIAPDSTTPIDYTRATGDPGLQTSPLCNNYNFSNNEGVDPAMLKTIAHLESGGCSNPSAVSSRGACGLMQMLPSTASRLNGSSVTCDQLRNNPDLSIRLAAIYVRQNMNSEGVRAARNRDSAIFSGYNSGYSTTPGSSPTGRDPALAPSRDCPGVRAFECPRNPGNISESMIYAYNGVGLYARYRNSLSN